MKTANKSTWTALSQAKRLVRQMAEIKEQVADLKKTEDGLRAKLLELEPDVGSEIDSGPFHCCISHFEVNRVDYKGVVADLPPTPALAKLIKLHTELSDRTAVNISTRKEYK